MARRRTIPCEVFERITVGRYPSGKSNIFFGGIEDNFALSSNKDIAKTFKEVPKYGYAYLLMYLNKGNWREETLTFKNLDFNWQVFSWE